MIFRNRLIVVALFSMIVSSCSDAVILPEQYELAEKTSFYCGLYETTISDMKPPGEFTLKDLDQYPKENDYFGDNLIPDGWSEVNIDSPIYEGIIEEMSESIDVSGEESQLWLNSIIHELNTNNQIYYISGFYKKMLITKPDHYVRVYYHYYLINKDKNEFIEFNRTPDM